MFLLEDTEGISLQVVLPGTARYTEPEELLLAGIGLRYNE